MRVQRKTLHKIQILSILISFIPIIATDAWAQKTVDDAVFVKIDPNDDEAGIAYDTDPPETNAPAVDDDTDLDETIIVDDLEVGPLQVVQLFTAQTTYSDSDLDQHALRIEANCRPSNLNSDVKAATVPLGDDFYVIPIRIDALPPYPGNGGKTGIHGVDVNKNCVRDDIEHYIFGQFPRKEQKQIRRYLYEYTIWLNFFLIHNLSEKSARAVARQQIKTGSCLDKIMTYSKSKDARDGLFENIHNTHQRTMKYFENMETLSGFLLESDIKPSC